MGVADGFKIQAGPVGGGKLLSIILHFIWILQSTYLPRLDYFNFSKIKICLRPTLRHVHKPLCVLKNERINRSFFTLVSRTGLEPACREALPPQGSGSTNFPTWTLRCFEVALLCLIKNTISTLAWHPWLRVPDKVPNFIVNIRMRGKDSLAVPVT